MPSMIKATYSINGGPEKSTNIPTEIQAKDGPDDILIFSMASEASQHLAHLGKVEILDVSLE